MYLTAGYLNEAFGPCLRHVFFSFALLGFPCLVRERLIKAEKASQGKRRPGGRLLRWYHFIELNKNPVRVLGKGTTNRAGFGLRQSVRRGNESYPFALEFFVDRVQPFDPKSDVRDTELIDFNTGAGRRCVERRDQGDDWRLLTHAVGCCVLLAVAQDGKTDPAVLSFIDALLVFAPLHVSSFLRDLKAQEVPVEMHRAIEIPYTQGNMRHASRRHKSPPFCSSWSRGQFI